MRSEHLPLLICTACGGDLYLKEVTAQEADRIEEGRLSCKNCGASYPIVKGIPRFVPVENYASSFGYQWIKHARTQYDSYTGVNVSEKRFFDETKWGRDLSGQIILEAGCGSGRFTEQALSTGATVVSFDYSYAVEANYQSHAQRENVLIVQADIYRMPFRTDFFDKLYCFGVLQHLPDPRGGFMKLIPHLKKGGSLAVDVYRRKAPWIQIFNTKYWVRPFTKRMQPSQLYNALSAYVKFMWPIMGILNSIPGADHFTSRFLVADYRHTYPLSPELHKEWAVLDTFDMLSPAYDFPQTLDTIRQWFADAQLEEAVVQYGYNGIEGRGIRSQSDI